MIVKLNELTKINLDKKKYFLLYGVNEGGKEEIIEQIQKNLKISQILRFDEKEVINNKEILLTEIMEESLFDNKKIILINRVSEKLVKILENIIDKTYNDTTILLNAGQLEKKSKLRNIFEKNENLVCIPFYSDNPQALSLIAFNFLKEKKINISQQNLSLLIGKCNGDRGILKNELNKINFYMINKKTLNTEDLLKLTNLIENHSLSELVDNCLAKNHRKTLKILNENLYGDDDCIFILRTFLNKSKKILKLANEYENNKDINLTITSARPPIFWKDKEIIKQQLLKLTSKKIKSLIYELGEIELLIKKNINNSTNLIRDFIITHSTT